MVDNLGVMLKKIRRSTVGPRENRCRVIDNHPASALRKQLQSHSNSLGSNYMAWIILWEVTPRKRDNWAFAMSGDPPAVFVGANDFLNGSTESDSRSQ